MIVIGLTGGVGCGKSTITKLLKDKYNAHVIDTDTLGHEVMLPGGACYQAILDTFGDVTSPDGTIDRQRLASVVFSNTDLREKLNAIVHPAVIRRVNEQIEAKRKEGTCPFVVMETALMIESGLADLCDEVWYVYADDACRTVRLAASRGYSIERINAVMSSQKKDNEFREIADVVIDNSGTAAETECQVDAAILKKLSC